MSTNDLVDVMREWSRRSQSKRALDAMLSVAEPQLAVTPGELDADPMLLNVENGTLNLRDGTLGEHDPEDLITKIAPVAYDPDARAPIFDAFLEKITKGDREKAEYLQRIYGYALTGEIGERCMFFLVGDGANGKTTLNECMAGLMGDYARHALADTFLRGGKSPISNDVARLAGVRLATVSEIGADQRLDESGVKGLTGGDTITARPMYREYFDFVPQFKVVVTCNGLPEIKGTDRAIRDRIKVVELGVRIPKAEQDPKLREKLAAERSGILNWALEGLCQWREGGLREPHGVRESVAAHFAEFDDVARFVAGRCVPAGGQVGDKVADIYGAYSQWCEDEELSPMPSVALGRELSQRGYRSKSVRTGRSKVRINIGLRLR
jgi:putative DNA primase/helicase